MGTFWSVALLIVSGLLNGSSATPLKYAKNSDWKNVWLIQSVVAVLLAWLLVWKTIPQPIGVYRASGTYTVLIVTGFGLAWGVGNLLYVVGIVMVGLSISFAIILSLTATLGALLPLAILQPEEL